MSNSLETARYITLHGPDGSGKTTVGRALANRLETNGSPAVFFPDWRVQNDIANPFYEPLRTEEAKEPQLLLSLVLAKLAFDSWHINELLEQDVNVIKDRGLFDVRADMAWRGMDALLCDSPAIKAPDFSVYLDVGESARLRHLAVKPDSNADDYEPNEPGTRMHTLARYVLGEVTALEKRGQGMVLPSDSLSIEEIVERVEETLRDPQGHHVA